jgi:hypothetical protein
VVDNLPRGGQPQWKRRLEPVLDAHLQASVTQASGTHDSDGHYATIHYTGCETRERAKEIVQALHRSGRHLVLSVSAKVIPASDGTFTVEYCAIDKAHARAHVLAKYGSDRSKWPYDPRRKGNQ